MKARKRISPFPFLVVFLLIALNMSPNAYAIVHKQFNFNPKDLVYTRFISFDQIVVWEFWSEQNTKTEIILENPPQVRTGEILEKKTSPSIVLTMKHETNMNLISDLLGESFMKMMNYIGESGTSMVGAPFSIYHSFADSNGDVTIECGIPVSEMVESSGDIKCKELPEQRVVCAKHYGHYQTISITYEALNKYISEKNKMIVGSPWEEYVVDPSTVASENDIETIVYFPVK